ncbi:heat shock factor-binding protein 1 [Petromyzon marinus]|uniref:Heat shock factor-binding protein 1 n=1 Tax=Petromyzon marinus TaxID=7757 RepID=A0AAJ7XDA2_PETMA|nr:heat shock factor-binding protein 1 [Petromyzon marinus]
MADTDSKSMQEVATVVENLLQQMQEKFQAMSDQILGRIDEMNSRIDDLEKNVAELMTHVDGEEEGGVENKDPN